MQEKLIVVKDERLMLLKKLCHLQGEIDPAALLAKSQMGSGSSPIPNPDGFTPKKSIKKRSSVETPGKFVQYAANPMLQN